MSVKIRGGSQLDLKVARGTRGVLEVPGRAAGEMESWQKWAFPLPSGLGRGRRVTGVDHRSEGQAHPPVLARGRRLVRAGTRRGRCSVVRGRAHGRVRGRRAMVDAGFRGDRSRRGVAGNDRRRRGFGLRRSHPRHRGAHGGRFDVLHGLAPVRVTGRRTPRVIGSTDPGLAGQVQATRGFHPFQMMMSSVTRWWASKRRSRDRTGEVAP